MVRRRFISEESLCLAAEGGHCSLYTTRKQSFRASCNVKSGGQDQQCGEGAGDEGEEGGEEGGGELLREAGHQHGNHR